MNSRAHINVHAKRRQPDGGFKRTRSQHRSLLCAQSNRGDKTAQAALLAFPCSNQMSQFNAHIRGLFTAAFGQFCPGWTSIQQPFYVGKCLAVAQQDDMEDTTNGNFLLEPGPGALLDAILPLYAFNMLTHSVLESKASEQSARMVAMKSATENAKKLIGELTLDYNKARQTQITNELLEITTAMKAME